jgi:hypothetical protein
LVGGHRLDDERCFGCNVVVEVVVEHGEVRGVEHEVEHLLGEVHSLILADYYSYLGERVVVG